MTLEDRVVVEVTDLATVRFVCTAAHCGASVNIRAADFRALQAHCPGCDTQWIIPNGAEDLAVRQLMHSLKDLAASAVTGKIRVCFDLTTRHE
jgi:hypothetical protein